MEMTDNVEQTETPQEQKQSSRNLTPLKIEKNYHF